MLRRAPTSISLSNRDVAEHLEHIELQKRRDRENTHYRQLEQISYSKTSGFRSPALSSFRGENWKRQAASPEHELYRRDTGISFYAVDSQNGESQEELEQQAAQTDQDPYRRRSNQRANSEPVLDPCSGSEDEDGFIPIMSTAPPDSYEEGTAMLPEEYRSQAQCSSLPILVPGFADTASEESLSFDVSTPVTNQVRSLQRLRSRIPLPRSPLYNSHGANSPDRRTTGSLTPYLPVYETPGLLLSQPARRPKSYRPRSESYSYEESERASAGYDDIQGSDNESNSSRAPQEERRGSHDDVYRRPSRDGLMDRNISSSPLPSTDNRRTQSSTSQPEQVAAENRIFYFSSPRLPLPPPFSAVPRDLSPASAPSVTREEQHFRSPSTSPPRSGVRGLRASPADRSSGSPDIEQAGSAASSILHNLTSLPIRLLEAYRSRSPLLSHSDTSGSEVTSSTRRMTMRVHSPDLVPTSTTTSEQFHIYDDRRPASVQPQTPHHLPESRHQSQFHPAYTAPAGPGMGSIRRSGWELRQRRRTRSDSPAGMETPGFRGLYGGQENADDEVTFTRAARRLRFLDSARRSGRSMSSTPGGEMALDD